MAFGKWIGGLFGFINTGGNILGAIAGFVLGSLFDSFIEKKEMNWEQQVNNPEDEEYVKQSRNETRDDFLFSLMVL